jgi:hypothetical protein
MFRTLTGRGLAVVSALLVTLFGPVSLAAANDASPDPVPYRVVAARGTWTDPGLVIDSTTPRADGKLVVVAHGGTHSTGTFAGDSTYQTTVVFDPSTGLAVGRNIETWTADVAGRGSGHVTFVEHVHQNGDGSTRVTGVVTGGDGVFTGATGLAVWTGSFAVSGGGSGTYAMVLGLTR